MDTIAFDYGQRHKVELLVRKTFLNEIRYINNWRDKLSEDHIIDIKNFGKISSTSLTDEVPITAEHGKLPNTFVPGRNLIFLTMTASVCYRKQIDNIIGGMCETDNLGYPDCRDSSIKAQQVAINLGMDKEFIIHTPLMFTSKKQTWEMAKNLGGQKLEDLIITNTHTCYLGIRSKGYEWGYGCGKCPACLVRAKGWSEYKSTL